MRPGDADLDRGGRDRHAARSAGTGRAGAGGAQGETEIAHLKLLLDKLRRMLFGAKSEKLVRQVEQLEFQLEELEVSRAE